VTILGIDVGGSGVKGAPVDLATGKLTGARHRIVTPRPATPEAVAAVVGKVAEFHGWRGITGVTVPAVVQHGVVRSAANIDQGWVGVDAVALLQPEVGGPVTVLNDADAAGLAEVHYGAGKGISGVVIVLTFGTGIGSAVIHDGKLLPNTEFGHLEFHGMDAEHYAAARLVDDPVSPITRDEWIARVNEYLAHIDFLFSPDLLILGGGISRSFEEFGHALEADAPIVPAQLRNNAGIVGAALAASSAEVFHG
jgi:polyphosphate glucokinase